MGSKSNVLISFLLCGLLIVSVSCQKHKTEWLGTVEESDGVIVVKNPKEPIYKEEICQLEEELSIGVQDGPEEYMFSRIGHIAVDHLERIYVLDSKESHIKLFDTNGNYVKTIGKKGEGPGEIFYSNRIAVNREELIVDDANRRLSFFSLKGEFLRNLSTKETWVLGARIDSVGNIIVTEGLVDPENPSYCVKKFDSEMNLLIEIARSPAPDIRKGFDPFMAISTWTLDQDDNIIYGYPKDYELKFYNPDGKLIKKITKEYDPVEVTEEEIEARTKRSPPNTKFAFSKYHSAFRRFLVDDEGRIFVNTWEWEENEEKYYHDVFDSEGRYIAKILMKERPTVCLRNKLYSLEEDEDGFQVVKRYRVNWSIE